VLRRIDGTRPKVLGYPAPQAAGMAWLAWFRAKPGVTVVVEDVFSAMRLWQVGITAAALLGTSLSEAKAAELRRRNPRVVVALDDDASATAIEAARRHQFEYRRLLGDDLKDMTEEQLTEWITTRISSQPVSPAAPPTSL
jgi:hypothetical protein